MSEVRFTEEQIEKFSKEVVPMVENLFKAVQEKGVVGGIRIYSDGKDYATIEGEGLGGWSLMKLNGEYQLRYNKSIKL